MSKASEVEIETLTIEKPRWRDDEVRRTVEMAFYHLRQRGVSWRQLARVVGIPQTTLYDRLSAIPEGAKQRVDRLLG